MEDKPEERKDDTATLSKGLEHFVGLLRNKKKAKNVDVQLYLEDLDKLKFKMEYLRGEELTLEVVKLQKKSLEAIQSKFESDEVSKGYSYFIKFGIAFAEYAEKALALTECNRKIEEFNK